MSNPSSGLVVRVEHLPDRTYRLWLELATGPVDLGRCERTSHLYEHAHTGTAAHLGIAADSLDAVELMTPTPPYISKRQAVLAMADDGRLLPGYIVGYAQGGIHVDTEEGHGIYAPEEIDFDPPAAAMTYPGQHRG